jgi:hypothetical protein
MSAAAGMVMVAFGMIAGIAGGGWLVWRARASGSSRLIGAAGATVAAAAFLVMLLVSGLRHFGSGTVCAQWWMEIDSATGIDRRSGAPAPGCRHAAVHAVSTALTQAALLAAVWAALVTGYLLLRRRAVSSAAG